MRHGQRIFGRNAYSEVTAALQNLADVCLGALVNAFGCSSAAWMAMVPRTLAGQLRFSMSLPTLKTVQAQG